MIKVRRRGPGAWKVTLSTRRSHHSIWFGLPQYTKLARQPAADGSYDFTRVSMTRASPGSAGGGSPTGSGVLHIDGRAG